MREPPAGSYRRRHGDGRREHRLSAPQFDRRRRRRRLLTTEALLGPLQGHIDALDAEFGAGDDGTSAAAR